MAGGGLCSAGWQPRSLVGRGRRRAPGVQNLLPRHDRPPLTGATQCRRCSGGHRRRYQRLGSRCEPDSHSLWLQVSAPRSVRHSYHSFVGTRGIPGGQPNKYLNKVLLYGYSVFPSRCGCWRATVGGRAFLGTGPAPDVDAFWTAQSSVIRALAAVLAARRGRKPAPRCLAQQASWPAPSRRAASSEIGTLVASQHHLVGDAARARTVVTLEYQPSITLECRVNP